MIVVVVVVFVVVGTILAMHIRISKSSSSGSSVV